jgi:DNA-binding transcriptional ArsR family regulator
LKDPRLDPRLLDRLKAYRALEHPVRLKAYIAIHDEPDVSFNKLAKKLSISSGLAAYHVAVLRAAGLVDVDYVRRSRETSEYRLSEKGKEVYRDVLGSSEPKVKGQKKKE